MTKNFKQPKLSRNEIYFTVIFFAIAVALVSGIYFLKGNPRLTARFLKSQADYYKYWFLGQTGLARYFSFGNYGKEAVAAVNTSAETIPVLVYHGVVGNDDSFNLTLDAFREQMRALKEAGYRTITMKEFSEYSQGRKVEPNIILLTFDDGRKDSYYLVDPVLKIYGFNAVMFVITGRSLGEKKYNNSFYLDEMELKQMLKSGRWEIQSHGKEAHNFYPVDASGTLGHFYVNKLWLANENRLETDQEFQARILNDFIESKQTIEDRLGVEANALAFPFGDFGETSFNFPGAEKIVVSAFEKVYNFSFFQYWPRVDYNYRANYAKDLADKSAVVRIRANPKWNARDLLRVLEASDAKNLPYAENWENPERWLSAYGDAYIDTENKAMVITTTSRGLAMTYLDGSYLWRDYGFSVHFRDKPGKNTVSLVSRFRNSLNYNECVYEPNAVYIRQISGSKSNLLGVAVLKEGLENTALSSPTGMIFKMVSQGAKTMCEINGQEAVRADIAAFGSLFEPFSGGVGIKIWNVQKAEGRTIVDEIKINPLN